VSILPTPEKLELAIEGVAPEEVSSMYSGRNFLGGFEFVVLGASASFLGIMMPQPVFFLVDFMQTLSHQSFVGLPIPLPYLHFTDSFHWTTFRWGDLPGNNSLHYVYESIAELGDETMTHAGSLTDGMGEGATRRLLGLNELRDRFVGKNEEVSELFLVQLGWVFSCMVICGLLALALRRNHLAATLAAGLCVRLLCVAYGPLCVGAFYAVFVAGMVDEKFGASAVLGIAWIFLSVTVPMLAYKNGRIIPSTFMLHSTAKKYESSMPSTPYLPSRSRSLKQAGIPDQKLKKHSALKLSKCASLPPLPPPPALPQALPPMRLSQSPLAAEEALSTFMPPLRLSRSPLILSRSPLFADKASSSFLIGVSQVWPRFLNCHAFFYFYVALFSSG
jgi:hypothetical protein